MEQEASERSAFRNNTRSPHAEPFSLRSWATTMWAAGERSSQSQTRPNFGHSFAKSGLDGAKLRRSRRIGAQYRRTSMSIPKMCLRRSGAITDQRSAILAVK